MYIFDKDYPYKLTLLGSASSGQKYEKDLIIIKSHGQIFSIYHSYNEIDKSNTLTFNAGYFIENIEEMSEFAICKKEINLERFYNKDFDIYKIPFPGLAIALYEEGEEIIISDNFSLQLSTNTMISSVYELELVDLNTFINHLEKEQ